MKVKNLILSKKKITYRIATSALTISIVTMPIFAISCGTKDVKKDYKQFGAESFAKEYKNLSYKDEADSVKLINEINYNKPRANTMYQMLVYAFADGNNDGIGDFIGAKEKLGYLEKLGIDQIWLSPIHPASSYHGYDVLDYTAVAPELGGMKAFDDFLKEAHKKNIKIYLDAVYNHTSYMHPWFQEALNNKNSKYRKYYNFDEKASGALGDTNILDEAQISRFINRDKNKVVKPSKVPYISKFWGGMPDLNLNNPEVIEELGNVQRYWIKKGVDGFRYDAFTEYYSSKGEKQTNFNVQKLFSTLRKAGEVGAKENKRNSKFNQFMMGEWWEGAKKGAQYFMNNKERALDTTYDRKHWNITADVSISVNDTKDILDLYKNISPHAQWVPFLDNHDFPRWIEKYLMNIRGMNGKQVEEKLDTKSVNAMSTALFALMTRPANPIIYQGDELAYHATKKDGDAKFREPIKWRDNKFNINFYEKRSGKKERIKISVSDDRPNADEEIINPHEPAYAVSQINKWRRNNSFIGSSNSKTIEEAKKYIINKSNSYSSTFIRKNVSGTKKFLVAYAFSDNFNFEINSNIKIKNIVLSSKGTKVEGKKIILKENSYIILEIN